MDQALLERVLQLDADERRELVTAVQESLDDEEPTPEVAALIDERIAETDANPDDFVSLDEFEREVRANRRAA